MFCELVMGSQRNKCCIFVCKTPHVPASINNNFRGLLREYNQQHEIPIGAYTQLYHVSLVSWTTLRGKICNVFLLVRMLVKRIQNELLAFHKFIIVTYHEMRLVERNNQPHDPWHDKIPSQLLKATIESMSHDKIPCQQTDLILPIMKGKEWYLQAPMTYKIQYYRNIN